MKKKTLYGAWVNLGGLGTGKPLKLKKYTLSYWVNEGEMKNDFSFKKIGLDVQDRCVKFCSYNKREVEAFIKGVVASNTVATGAIFDKDGSIKWGL